jgi:hypothetical protein
MNIFISNFYHSGNSTEMKVAQFTTKSKEIK